MEFLKKCQELMNKHQEDQKLKEAECDHTLKNTEDWLKKMIKTKKRRDNIRQEILDNGGFCDCEVLFNCYEEYELT